jgi:hypothetical protein
MKSLISFKFFLPFLWLFFSNQTDPIEKNPCEYMYIVVWAGQPNSYNGYRPKVSERFLISNVFQTCQLVKSAYGGYYISDTLINEIKEFLQKKYELNSVLYDYQLYVSCTKTGTRTGTEVFSSESEAVKARKELIDFIRNANSPPNAPSLNGYSVLTNKIETFLY